MVDKIKIRADLSSKEDTVNKVTSLSSSSTNSQYPSAKAVYDMIQGLDTGGVGINDYYFDNSTKEIVLDYERSSGGSGGSYIDIVTEWEQTPSDENVASEKLTKDSLDGKLDNALSSTAVEMATNDYVLITDSSDGDKVKRTQLIPSAMKDPNAHDNIGTLANTSQGVINTAIDIAIGNKVSKSSTSGFLRNNGSVDTNTYSLSSHNHTGTYAESTHTHTQSEITDFPTIPSASSTVPSADTTNGSYGSGTSYARANHTHPQSSIYASSTHNHNYSELNNVSVVDVVVTYTDNSTETIKILRYTGT